RSFMHFHPGPFFDKRIPNFLAPHVTGHQYGGLSLRIPRVDNCGIRRGEFASFRRIASANGVKELRGGVHHLSPGNRKESQSANSVMQKLYRRARSLRTASSIKASSSSRLRVISSVTFSTSS